VSSLKPSTRNALLVGGVLALHLGALWALQQGLLRRAVELVVPAQVLADLSAPPPPVEPPPPPPPPPPAPRPPPPAPAPRAQAPRPAPAPVPVAAPAPVLATESPAPAVSAPVLPQAPAPVLAPPAPAAAPVAAPPAAPPRVELPSSNADYLQNPPPPYPAMSRRLGEQGRVVVRVLIGADGLPQRAELRSTSGFDRLDQAALATVMRWRYVPGKRGGVAEAMWFNVPLNFVLD